MTVYRYVQARYDYGVRKGPTLGLMFHGAEANSGVVGYLSRDPARGVSANFVCERGTGRMVQMLPLDHASGSLNPADRSSNKAYFGHDHLVAVLGDWWTNPNAAVISVEIEMYASSGPDSAQVAGLTAWSADMVSHFPSIRGALGHADQTDTKPCPGTTTAMKSVFAAIGGHGLWGATETDMAISTRGLLLTSDHAITLPTNTSIYATPTSGATVLGTASGQVPYFGSPASGWKAVRVDLGSGSLIGYTTTAATVFAVPLPDTTPASVTYPVTVGGKPAGSVTLP